MRATLRRSCNACAKAKLRCDLRTPQCSRCLKRRSNCTYANEPLTSSPVVRASPPGTPGNHVPISGSTREASSESTSGTMIVPVVADSAVLLGNATDLSFDPFDSYPTTRLPRARVQRLIHHCNSPRRSVGFLGALLADFASSLEYRLSVLSFRPQRDVKPIRHLVVASRTFRPSLISCLFTNSIFRRRA